METHLIALKDNPAGPEAVVFPGVAPVRTFAGAPDIEIEFHEVWAALLRRRHILLLCVALGLLGGIAVALCSKPSYSATATVEFAQPNVHALGLDDPSMNASDVSTLELLNTELKTEQTEITDESTALAVIRQLRLEQQEPYRLPAHLGPSDPMARERGLPLEQAPHVRERIVTLFERNLNVDVVKGTRLLSIGFTDSDPERAAAIANAVVTASMEQTSGRHTAAFSQVSSWLQDQLGSLKQRVEDSQHRAEEYEAANQRDLAGMTISGGSGRNGQAEGPSASSSVPVSRLLTLNNDLTNAQVARIAKEAIYRVTQTDDPDAVLSIANSSLITGLGSDSSLAPNNNGMALLQHLREQQVQLNVQAGTAATKYGAKSPAMIDLHRQQAEVQAQMAVELNHIRGRAQNELRMAMNAENELREQVTAQQQEVSQWTTKADHLLLLQGEAASSRALYQELFAKLQESQFAAGMRASRVTVLDPARVPSSPTAPKKRVDVGLGGLVGVVFGFIAALFVELRDDSLHSEQQVRKVLGVPVLGAIPRGPERGREHKAWVVSEPRSPIAEAYRMCRTTLFASRVPAQCRTLVIASAGPQEDKAATCLNMAAALAVQGHRVLVVNADMRRAEEREYFGVKPGPGLSGCLACDVAVDEAIAPVPGVANLFALPSGPSPDNPSELLSSRRFQVVMDELRGQFDYILVDTPPALFFADAKILTSFVNGFVLVVQASRTPRGDVRRALDELCGSGANFAGILFHAAHAKLPAYAKFGYGA